MDKYSSYGNAMMEINKWGKLNGADLGEVGGQSDPFVVANCVIRVLIEGKEERNKNVLPVYKCSCGSKNAVKFHGYMKYHRVSKS
jgi:hypothetical protein